MSRTGGNKRLVQIAAGYAPYDAIAAEMDRIAEYVRSGRARPFTSTVIAAEQIPPGLRRRCMRLEDLRPRRDDVLLLHYGMTLEALDRVADWDCAKALVYHNITPAEYFRKYDPVTAGRLMRAREELPAVVAACDMVFAVSEFNAKDVRAAGAAEVRIKPLLIPSSRLGGVREPRKGVPYTLLFVGRFAPNKNHLDLLKIAALLREQLPIRLILVGGAGGAMDAYARDLAAVAASFGMEADVDFVFDADDARLAALYSAADLFLCASGHEGFCAPLLEAMAAGVPVLARQADDTAVRETMAGAGIGFAPLRTRGDYLDLAHTAALLLTDGSLRAELLAGQARRLESYRPDEILADFFRSLNTLAR